MIRSLAPLTGLSLLLCLLCAGCDSGDSASGNADVSPAADIADVSPAADIAAAGDVAMDAEGPSLGFELAGTWTNNYAGTEVISDVEWDNGYSVMTVGQYDNEANRVTLQSPADDEFSPNLFTLTVWVEEDAGVVYSCTIAFGFETQEEAMAAEDTSDAADLLNAGCGGFGWTQLTRVE